MNTALSIHRTGLCRAADKHLEASNEPDTRGDLSLAEVDEAFAEAQAIEADRAYAEDSKRHRDRTEQDLAVREMDAARGRGETFA